MIYPAICLVLIGSCLAAASVDLIELNDANRNQLNLGLSKSVESVQKAVENEFRFGSIRELRDFIVKCQYANDVMATKSDDDYQGLAAKIKSTLADSGVKRACLIDADNLTQFAILDEKASDAAYLSQKRLDKFKEIEQILDQSAQLKSVLGSLFSAKTESMAEALLENSVQDTIILFNDQKSQGMFDFEIKYNTACETADLKQICKLARRTRSDTVSAMGRDFEELAVAIAEDDKDTIDKHVGASGVQIDELAKVCKNAKGNLHPMRMVEAYVKAGFLSSSAVKDLSDEDEAFNFYLQLERLCKPNY